ncbi:hypothetical protein MIM_c31840 [Advenella mimigardefordensis DPN7]|uniref:Uncharacterized protein n=1 Tax=Advenella mimigardefordensis (strain DSM 17166 / LMG 22922 / DPN7) TaxID=1247726 RepID=W0PJU3_ADVMD|nr:hypothetical protein MIM_c31840 [Advenella mimigardefordensis DPN7]
MHLVLFLSAFGAIIAVAMIGANWLDKRQRVVSEPVKPLVLPSQSKFAKYFK